MQDEPRVQIIGLGSPHGIDRLGWMAIEQLRQSGFAESFPPGVLGLQDCPSPAQLPALIRPGADLLLIDALQGLPLGEVLCLSWQDLRAAPLMSGSHGLGLREMLPLIELLYGPPQQTTILGIGMGDAQAAAPPALPAGVLPRLQREITRSVAGQLAG
jgi:hypothetical protein